MSRNGPHCLHHGCEGPSYIHRTILDLNDALDYGASQELSLASKAACMKASISAGPNTRTKEFIQTIF